ncbi:MAG TPA: hypothetical protein VMB84_08805 [Stellaceae bacterium]|nr:hypothetical protein [Stellaceae bacterium]
MVSATDFPDKTGLRSADESVRPMRRRRFRLFAALAAPFKDVDERAVRQRKNGAIRNNSKGNQRGKRHAAVARLPVKPFPRDD